MLKIYLQPIYWAGSTVFIKTFVFTPHGMFTFNRLKFHIFKKDR